MLIYEKGTIAVSKDLNIAYEKLEDSEISLWVSLTSRYTISEEVELNGKKEVRYFTRPESEKPLWDNNGKLNRFGWRWTDEQVKSYFSSFSFIRFLN